MELRELEYFRAVARWKSFRRAASELHVSQPTLSQQIKKLEGELGVALLARNSRAVAVTDSGHTFLQRVESILTEVQTARTEMQALGALAGKLVVGTTAMAQYHIPALLARFREENPNIDLVVKQLPHERMMSMLGAGDIHVGLVQVHRATSRVPAGVQMEHLADLVIGVVLRPDHPLARRATVRLTELRGERLILPFAGSAARAAVDLAFKKARVKFDITPFETSGSSAAVVALVAEGLGVGLASEPTARGSEHQLEFRPIAGADVSYEFALAWTSRFSAPLIEAFRRSARSWILPSPAPARDEQISTTDRGRGGSRRSEKPEARS